MESPQDMGAPLQFPFWIISRKSLRKKLKFESPNFRAT